MKGPNPDLPEIERIRRVYAADPLDDGDKWQVGEDLVSLLAGYQPKDKGDRERQREALLVRFAAAIGGGVTAAKLREVWRVSAILEGNRVEGKTFDEHWRAIHTSKPGRGQYDLDVALEILRGDPETLAAMDPISTIEGLSEKQQYQARRILRNHSDFADPAVVAAVTTVLRGKAKKGAVSVSSAEQEHLRNHRQRCADEAVEMALENPNIRVLTGYHDDLMALTDRVYSIKGLAEKLTDRVWRQTTKALLHGSLLAASGALEDLLDLLEGVVPDTESVDAVDAQASVVEPPLGITDASAA